MGLVRVALRNPHAVIVITLAVLLIGITALGRIPADILPVFKTPAVQILTFYPGMPAEVVEQDITTRLERWTGQSNGVARQESKSLIGVSIVKDFFRPDIDPNTAMSQVTSLAMSDLYYLPPGTIPPMVMPFDPTASIPLALITVSSPRFDETKLYDVAYFDLRNRLQGISGVIAPAVYGGKLRRILAYVDRDKLQARDFSPMDVVQALRSFNLMIPTGNAKFGSLDYQIDANSMVPRVEMMNDFPIKIDGGAPVFLKDVGKAEDSHQIQTNMVRISAPPDFEGKRQVYIPIYRQPGANTIQVVDGIRDTIGKILTRLPEGINLDVVMDQSVYVREAIRNLIGEGILGALMAALMILLFLGSVRSTAIVLIALPLAVLAAFIGLFFTGDSINAMTLGGLAMAVGLLIDQSIVVLENISRHLEEGKSSFQAALDGAGEVAMPVLIISITIVVVFFPVVFLTGIGKFLFTPLALSVTFAIAASYILSMTLVPAAAARFLKGADQVAQTTNKGFLFRLGARFCPAAGRLWPDTALKFGPYGYRPGDCRPCLCRVSTTDSCYRHRTLSRGGRWTAHGARACPVRHASGAHRGGRAACRLILGSDDEPALELYDKEKGRRIRLAVTTDGEPQLWLYDAHETPRIAAGLSPEGSATLGLSNSDHKATISLNMRADGNASLDLTDQEGKPRAILGYAELEVLPGGTLDKLPVFSLVLSDPSGRIIWKAP